MTTIGSVVLAGGGTAGHVNPLLAVADELRAREPGVVVTALGVAGGLEDDLVPARGYPLRHAARPAPAPPERGVGQPPGRLKSAVDAAGAVIDETGARVVVGFGATSRRPRTSPRAVATSPS